MKDKMTYPNIAKFVQIGCLILGIILMLVVKGNVKWFMLVVLGIGLVAHFGEYLLTEVKAELGKIDPSLAKKL